MADNKQMNGPENHSPASDLQRSHSPGSGGSDIQRRRLRGRRGLIMAIALLLLIALVGGIVLAPKILDDTDEPGTPTAIAGTQDTDDAVPAALAAPTPVTGQTVLDPDGGGAHIEVGKSHTAYNSIPATSGQHWTTPPSSLAPYGAPARWGVYTEALPDEVLVHNLEHGGIGLHYDCPSGCPDIVAALQGIVPSNPSQFVLSPYSGIPAPYTVAVTAWRYHMFLENVDRAAIMKFINEHQDNAPESVRGNLF